MFDLFLYVETMVTLEKDQQIIRAVQEHLHAIVYLYFLFLFT